MPRSSKSHQDQSFEMGNFSTLVGIEDHIERSVTDSEFSTLSIRTMEFSRTSSETSISSDTNYENSTPEESPHSLPLVSRPQTQSRGALVKLGIKRHTQVLDHKSEDHEASKSGLDIMKEKFSKLLLGEDMSGSGKGVSTAVAISNAITNLYATIFGQLWKLEPLSPGKKSMWRREMECLLSVCEYIVEFIPAWQTFLDGSRQEVMTSRPRTDIYINLPALQKLDAMLLEILDSFSSSADFWYADQGHGSSESEDSGCFQRLDDKWWLPVPCVPRNGLSDKSRKHLQHKRECANQILKAAMAINSSILAEMEVPESYLETLPKTGRASLGDAIHRYITNSEQFSSDYLLDCLHISSEHEALELADRFEAAIYVWKRKCAHNSKSSWDMVKDLMVDGEKIEMLVKRTESLLSNLKLRFPELSQTTLDTSKIQYNKDIGQSILESYSRVLESLAFNIVARIDDVLRVDDLTRNPNSSEHSPINRRVSNVGQFQLS
ncbi:hypothetical protein AMTRI_Chr07g30470 [Amborella trichopoda]